MHYISPIRRDIPKALRTAFFLSAFFCVLFLWSKTSPAAEPEIGEPSSPPIPAPVLPPPLPADAPTSVPAQETPAEPTEPPAPPADAAASDVPPVKEALPAETRETPATPPPAAPPEAAADAEPDQDTLRAARDAVNACWKAGTSLYLHGLNLDRCGQNLEAPLTRWLEARPRLIAGKEQGARLLMRNSSQPPNFTRVPTPLYLLLENADVLPENLRKSLADARKVLTGTPLEGMADGPLLLRLHPQKSTTAPLLRWYLSEGAAAGHALILGSRQDMDTLTRRVASWHLMLWEREKDAPRAMLARPANPGFLKAVLPGLRGKAAALFAGPGDGLWFRYPTPRGDLWYDIKAERALPSLNLPEATLVLPHGQVQALSEAFNTDYELHTARELQRDAPKRRVSPEKTLEFVRRVTRHINALSDVPGSRDWDIAARRSVLELLWQAYGTPAENSVAHALLADDDTPLETRLDAARALLRKD